MKYNTGINKLAETAKLSKPVKSNVELFTPVYITETYYIFESKINNENLEI